MVDGDAVTAPPVALLLQSATTAQPPLALLLQSATTAQPPLAPLLQSATAAPPPEIAAAADSAPEIAATTNPPPEIATTDPPLTVQDAAAETLTKRGRKRSAATTNTPPEIATTDPPLTVQDAAAETLTKRGRKTSRNLQPTDSTGATDLGDSIGERRKLTRRTCVGKMQEEKQVEEVKSEDEDDDNDEDDNDDEDEEESDDEEGNNNNKLTSRDIEIIQSVIDVDEDDEVVFDVADFSAKNIISQNQIVDDIKYVLNINLLPLSFFIHSTPNFLICEFFYIF